MALSTSTLLYCSHYRPVLVTVTSICFVAWIYCVTQRILVGSHQVRQQQRTYAAPRLGHTTLPRRDPVGRRPGADHYGGMGGPEAASIFETCIRHH